ncbi:MAG: glycosyltransferase family 4 protein [Chloroflexota bacterium]|nr:glycosyltransferase family 4 protein [Chloroflexota bacterium]
MRLQDCRVCMVGPHYPRPGGVTTQVELLSEYLRNDGVDVHSVDTNVQSLRRWGGVGRALLPFAQSVIVPGRLWRAAQGGDLVHVHLSSYWGFYLPISASLLVGRLKGLPVVATYHGGKAAQFVQRHKAIARAPLARIDALIALSRYTAPVFEALGIHPVIIPNLVREEEFSAKPAECFARDRWRGQRLLWIKQFNQVGNPQQMVRAFARIKQRLPDAMLTMIGEGELRSETEALSRSLSLPVTFTGRVPFAEIKTHYENADIFISTSTVDNQPSTFLEASSSGLPIVATAVGGVPFTVENNVNALLVEPGDEQALADAVVRIANDPRLAYRLSRAAVQNAETFSWPSIRDKITDLYLSVMEKPIQG